MAIDESDLSIRKLEDLHSQLQSLQKEKSDNQKLVLDHLIELESLCAVLGLDFKQTVHEVHPSLDKTQELNVSNDTIKKLASTKKNLRELKIERMQTLQGPVGNMLELRKLTGTQVEEEEKFHHAIRNTAVPEQEITEPCSLSADIINDVESEILRLQKLYASKMKELVLKKKTELEELRRQIHLVVDEDEGSEIEDIRTGFVHPSLVLQKIESQILATEGEAFRRKDILESAEELMVACKEESWLEEYNRDEAGRVAHPELQRAENARAVVSKIPMMIQNLLSRIKVWEGERDIKFTYDGDELSTMMENYIISSQRKEEERKRQRIARLEVPASPTVKHEKDPIQPTLPICGNAGVPVPENYQVVNKVQKICWLRVILTSLILVLVLQLVLVDLFMTVGKSMPLEFVTIFCGCALIGKWRWWVISFGFSREEIVLVRTVIITASSIIFGGGFTIFLSIRERKLGEGNLWKLGSEIWNMILFLLVLGYLGLFWVLHCKPSICNVQQQSSEEVESILELINSVHNVDINMDTSSRIRQARWRFYQSFLAGFVWALIGWFFTRGPKCGFRFVFVHLFGGLLFDLKFYFDFTLTNIGYGMVTPVKTSITMFCGSFLSWLVMWPFFKSKNTQWYSKPNDMDLGGIRGYQVFSFIAICMADAGFEFCRIIYRFFYHLWLRVAGYVTVDRVDNETREQEDQIFTSDISLIPRLFLYCLTLILTCVIVPLVFPSLSSYHAAIFYFASAALSIFTAYARRISDISFFSSSAPMALLILAAWIGSMWGGVLVGLSYCGILLCIIINISNFLLDFKLGFLSKTPFRLIVIGQILGIFIGSCVSPIVFLFFNNAFAVGKKSARYNAPYDSFFNAMEKIGALGFSFLPDYCAVFSSFWFVTTIVLKVVHDFLLYKDYITLLSFIPDPIVLSALFVVGGQFGVGVLIGTFVSHLLGKFLTGTYVEISAIAWGLILGETIWRFLAAVLSLVNVQPPWCF